MLIWFVALLLAGIVFIVWEKYTIQSSMVRELSIQAKMIAHTCKKALISQDTRAAHETLSALHVEPHIVYACVRKSSGEVLANYHRDANDSSVHLLHINEKATVSAIPL